MKEYVLKVFFAIALLFILFLWSGGIYEYQNKGLRFNKITGNIEQYSGNNNTWRAP
ncbi:MAG: hypothetical protein Q9M40_07210 [Sulfurimonas sp.]|nr:hypothetical protein [Sulfurimonas sp.]